MALYIPRFLSFSQTFKIDSSWNNRVLWEFFSDCKLSKWAPPCQTMRIHTHSHTVSLACHTVCTRMAAIFWVVFIHKANMCWLDTHLRTETKCSSEKLREISVTRIKVNPSSIWDFLFLTLICFRNMINAIIKSLKSYH